MNIVPIRALKLLVGLIILMPVGVLADSRSYSSDISAQIRYLHYHSNEVYVIDLVPNKGTLLLFASDEVITDIAIDEMDGFNFTQTTGANGLFLEYKSARKTNVTLLTNKRPYTLIMNGTYRVEGAPHYSQIRFKYDTNAEQSLIQISPQALQQRNAPPPDISGFGQKVQPASQYEVNVDYHWKGDSTLLPQRVFDNGLFTFFKFTGDVPAIYEVLKDGKERALNRHTEGDMVVVHRVARQLTLRLGDEALCIFNMHAVNSVSVGSGNLQSTREASR